MRPVRRLTENSNMWCWDDQTEQADILAAGSSRTGPGQPRRATKPDLRGIRATVGISAEQQAGSDPFSNFTLIQDAGLPSLPNFGDDSGVGPGIDAPDGGHEFAAGGLDFGAMGIDEFGFADPGFVSDIDDILRPPMGNPSLATESTPGRFSGPWGAILFF